MIEPEVLALVGGGNIMGLGVMGFFIKYMLGRERTHYENGSGITRKLDRLIELQIQHNTYASAQSDTMQEFMREVRDRLN